MQKIFILFQILLWVVFLKAFLAFYSTYIFAEIQKVRLEKELKAWIERPPTNNTKMFEDILSKHSVIDIITSLEAVVPEDTFGSLADSFGPFLQTHSHTINTIGLFYERYSHGGTERVMSLHIQLYLEMGYSVVLFTEVITPETEYQLDERVRRVLLPSQYSRGRAAVIANTVREEGIDIFIHHSHLSHNLLFDLVLLKSLNVFTIVYRHMVIFESLFIDDPRILTFHKIFRIADITIVISRTEEAYLQAMGVLTKYIPNPVQFANISHNYKNNEGIILWVGRLMDADKHFSAALRIMNLVVKQRPDAQMVMLGESYKPEHKQFLLSYVKKHRLSNNIHYYGHVDNISLWYEKARIHLLTSHSECFPMVVLESKAYGIPLVTFSLPYVELLKDKRGYIEVPQYEYQMAADAIVRLLSDDDLCHRLSEEAKLSLAPFKAYDQTRAWKELFTKLETKETLPKSDQVSAREVQILLETIFKQYKAYRENR